MKPAKLYEALQKLSEEQRSAKRGEMSIRQLSLLRARMRADLEVYGTIFFGELQDEDKEFLEYCGENLNRKPWSSQRKPDIMDRRFNKPNQFGYSLVFKTQEQAESNLTLN